MIKALKTCFACVALILAPALAAAQGTTGSISGSVVDESKSVLPGVTITVTNLGTGLERVQVSDTDGRYRILDLPPGQYTVKAEISGFAPVLRSDLTVAIGRDLLADIEMKVRGVTEQVTVVGESSNVSLGTTTAGGVVTTQQIAELPLNGRSLHAARHLAARRHHQPRDGERLHRRLRHHPARDRRRPSRTDRLSDGRHEHRGHLGQGAVEPVGAPARRRHRPGIQRADARLQRRVRPRGGRRHEHGDQVGHEPDSRQRLRVPPRRNAGLQELLRDRRSS